jgi:hypothetical protein
VNRVEEVAVVHGPNQEADDTNDLGQKLAEVVKLLLQRGVFLLLSGLLDLILHAADGSLHASVHDNADGGAIVDDCRREKHVLLVRQQLDVLAHGNRGLLHRHRFASKWCLLHLE